MNSVLSLFTASCGIPQLPSAKQYFYHEYLAAWEGKKIDHPKHIKRGLSKRDKIDNRIDYKLSQIGIKTKKISWKTGNVLFAEGLYKATMPYSNVYQIGDISMPDRYKSPLWARTQQQSKKDAVASLSYFAQGKPKDFRQLTITPRQRHIPYSRAASCIKELKTEFATKSRYWRRRYGFDCIAMRVHIGASKGGCRPHLHIIYRISKRLSDKEWGRLTKLVEGLGAANFGKPTRNFAALAHYIFRVHDYSQLPSYQLATLWHTLKGLRLTEYYGDLRKMRHKHAEDRVKPRRIGKQWRLVPKQILIPDEDEEDKSDEPYIIDMSDMSVDDYSIDKLCSEMQQSIELGEHVYANVETARFEIRTLLYKQDFIQKRLKLLYAGDDETELARERVPKKATAASHLPIHPLNRNFLDKKVTDLSPPPLAPPPAPPDLVKKRHENLINTTKHIYKKDEIISLESFILSLQQRHVFK